MSHPIRFCLLRQNHVCNPGSDLLSVDVTCGQRPSCVRRSVCSFPIFPAPVRPCREVRIFFKSWPEQALIGPTYGNFHSNGGFIQNVMPLLHATGLGSISCKQHWELLTCSESSIKVLSNKTRGAQIPYE
jgi:hypothetical protein